MKLTIIITIYNEASTLAALLARVQAVPVDKEILIVDDNKDIRTCPLQPTFDELKALFSVSQSVVSQRLGRHDEQPILRHRDTRHEPEPFLKRVLPVLQIDDQNSPTYRNVHTEERLLAN